MANLLGYENYAALAMDGLMIKSPDRANVFLNDLGQAVKKAAKKDLSILLKTKRN